MGSHSWHCRWCGSVQVTYNGCKNRHCASCGTFERGEWVERVLSWALPVDYFHVVFTLPHEFIPLILANPGPLYRLFFDCVRQTLLGVARTEYGTKLGLVLVLHTWGQQGNCHPHIHVVVTAGGLSLDKNRWIIFSADDPAFSRTTLADKFQDRFVRGLYRLYRQQRLTMPQSMVHVACETDLERWLQPVEAKQWQVNVQTAPPHCRGPEAVLKYLAGYVVGAAIRDRRILRYDGRAVVISYKDYRTGERKELPLTGEEFVTRYARHILPAGFLRLRYAGLFGPRGRKERLAACRAVLTPEHTVLPL